MLRWYALIVLIATSLIATSALAEEDAETRIAALEATIAAQAEQIEALEAALEARPTQADVDAVAARNRTLTLRAGTLNTALSTCRGEQRVLTNQNRTLERQEARLSTAVRASDAERQRLRSALRLAEGNARRAEQDVRRLRNDLRRCR